MSLKIQFGIKCRARRLKKKLSVDEASQGIGISKVALYNIERGFAAPRLLVLKKITNFYGKSILNDILT